MGKPESFTPGRWQVERERSRIPSRTPLPASREADPVANVIPALMKRLGLEDQQWMDVLAAEWAALVGEAVARHTRPGRVQRDNLVVFVDNSAWLSELARYSRGPMLANLQKRFGKDKILSVSFQLDPDETRPSTPRARDA